MQTIAREGVKYNVFACALATGSTVGPTGEATHNAIGGGLRSIAALSHPSTRETGHLYHVEGNQCKKLRWQRAGGAWQNPDTGFTPGSIQSKWTDVNDFSNGSYPSSSSDFQAVLARTKKLSLGDSGRDIRFDGKVVLITGAGSGYRFSSWATNISDELTPLAG